MERMTGDGRFAGRGVALVVALVAAQIAGCMIAVKPLGQGEQAHILRDQMPTPQRTVRIEYGRQMESQPARAAASIMADCPPCRPQKEFNACSPPTPPTATVGQPLPNVSATPQ